MVQLAAIPVLFFIGVKLSLAFAFTSDVIVLLWMPNSLILAALLHYGLRRYIPFVALILAAEIAADYPTFSIFEALGFGLINIAEATLAYSLLRRWSFDPGFGTPMDLGKFFLAGPFIAALLAAFTAGALHIYGQGHVRYLDFVRVWWFSDGLGVLILTPLVLSLLRSGMKSHNNRAPFSLYDVLAIAGGALMLIAFTFAQQARFHGIPVRSVLLLPFVLYAAARFSLRSTSTLVAAVAIVVLYVTKAGRQPFGPLPLPDTLIAVQEFIFTMSVMALGLNALLAQHRKDTRELERRVEERTTELSTANRKLEELALTDVLTGLPNRRAMLEMLLAEMNRQRRVGHGVAVIMFDLDNFKTINDRYGHPVGDSVLQRAARQSAKVVREMDMLSRYGGEEFVLIAPQIDGAAARSLAERMRSEIESSPLNVVGQKLSVTASFGVAMLRTDDDAPEQVLKRADAALYSAKAAGRNQVAVAEMALGNA